jgi:hypothetical protein
LEEGARRNPKEGARNEEAERRGRIKAETINSL